MSEDEGVRILIEAKDAQRTAFDAFEDARLRMIEADRTLKAADEGIRAAVLETATVLKRVEAARILGVTHGRISQIVTGGAV